jgi:hypothetical protein
MVSMAEKSHRDEMNAAIRAQRERQAVPRSIAGPEEPPEAAPEQEPEAVPAPEHPARKGLLSRLLGH